MLILLLLLLLVSAAKDRWHVRTNIGVSLNSVLSLRSLILLLTAVLLICDRYTWSPHDNKCRPDLDGLLVELVEEALAGFRNVLNICLSGLVHT